MKKLRAEKNRVKRAQKALSIWPLPEDSLIQKGSGDTGDGLHGSPRTNRLGVTYPHNDIDVIAEEGSDILAPADGTYVWDGSEDEPAGFFVKITHGEIETTYSHLQKPENFNDIKGKETAIAAGASFGKVGRSGNPPEGSKTHVHFVIRVNNITIDPRKVFNYGYEGDSR
ncbi:MAG: M23 family metallopeptidase [Gammaproteobacteria bacterium]|nr:M23 family metallopeptidase [Gammaproteobacteria bacterium]